MASTNYLTGSKKRIYQILSSSEKGKNLINDYAAQNFVQSYSSLKSAYDNKANYINFLTKIIDGVKCVLEYLKIADSTGLNKQYVIAFLEDVIKISDNVSSKIKALNDLQSFSNDDMKTAIDNLDKEFKVMNGTTLLTGKFIFQQIFKQVYSLIYGFIMNYNPYSRSSKIGRNKTFISEYDDEATSYDLDDIVPGEIHKKSFEKTEAIYQWLSGKMNWTLPICCIDKLLLCYSANTNIDILNAINVSLPYLRFFGTKLKCSPESFISGLEYGIIANDGNKVFRTTKKIKNVNGKLKLKLTVINKIYNFNNILTVKENNLNFFYYEICVNNNYINDVKALINEFNKTIGDNKNIKEMEVEEDFVNKIGRQNKLEEVKSKKSSSVKGNKLTPAAPVNKDTRVSSNRKRKVSGEDSKQEIIEEDIEEDNEEDA